MAEPATDFGLDDAAGGDFTCFGEEGEGLEGIVSVAGLLDVPATVHEDGAAHGEECQGLAVTL